MRLSTDPGRDEAQGAAVLHAALSAGVRLLDTADAYAHDDADAGHNERLIARTLAAFEGDRSSVRVATKGGLVRPGGRWVPDARARHLRAACARSLAALGVARIDLYQLHAVDPRTDLAVGVRALARLQAEGLIAAVGLCNVNVAQIERACAIVEVASVQVELGPLDTSAIRGGVVAHCLSRGITLLAHRPLGGVAGCRRLARDPLFLEIASRHGATPAEVALAWLRDLDPRIVPLPGPTRVETAGSCARAAGIVLGDDDRRLLDERFPEAASLRSGRERSAARGTPIPSPAAPAEVTVVMGIGGSGKSTVARELAASGALRLNRDDRGGRLAGIAKALDQALVAGTLRVVMDNTYVSRASRGEILEVARRHGARVRCIWVDAPLPQAQVNACERMVARHGRLLGPEEMARAGKEEPESFPPRVQFQQARALEPPSVEEGFVSVERRPFVRSGASVRPRIALFVELDGVVWRSRSGARTPVSAADLEVVPGTAEAVAARARDGVVVVATSWQPEVARGERTSEAVEGCVAALRELVGVDVAFAFCPHDAGPPVCWCRKPLPGLGVAMAHALGLDLSRSLCVGKGAADEGFAARLGMVYADAGAFFGSPGVE